MRMVFGLVLVLGIGLAGFAVFMAKGYFEQQNAEKARLREETKKIIPTVDIYVAKRGLTYGERLTKDDVQKVAWPETSVPKGAFKEIDAIFPQGDAVLRTVTRAMEANEAVLAVKVTEPGVLAGITTRLTKGKRAFTINVNVSSGVSGFLHPGDQVDIYWSGQINRQPVTKLIEAGVRVIAVDQAADGDRSEIRVAKTVTVEISPQEVANLTQAQSTGDLTLSLVGIADDTIATATDVDQRTLLGIVEEETVEVVAEKICTITTNKGGEKIKTEIPCTN